MAVKDQMSGVDAQFSTGSKSKHHDGRPSEYMASYENSKVSASRPNASGSQAVRNSWLQKLDEWTFTDRGVFEIIQPAKGSEDAPHAIRNAPYKKNLKPVWKTKHWGTLHQKMYDEKIPNPGKRNVGEAGRSRPPLRSSTNLNSTYKTEFRGSRSQSEPNVKPKGSKQNKIFDEWKNPPKEDEWKITDNGVWVLVDAKNEQMVDSKNRPLGLIDPDWKSKHWGSLYRTIYTQKVPNPSKVKFSNNPWHGKGPPKEPEPGKYLPHGGYVSDYRGHYHDLRPKSVPNVRETKQNKNWLKAQAQTQDSWRFTDRGMWEQFSAAGKNLTRSSKQNLDTNWQSKHWGSTVRTDFCEKAPIKDKRHSLSSAAWLIPDHPFWKDKPQKRPPVREDTEYGQQFEMPIDLTKT